MSHHEARFFFGKCLKSVTVASVPKPHIFSKEYTRVQVQVPPDLYDALDLQRAIAERKASDVILQHVRAALAAAQLDGSQQQLQAAVATLAIKVLRSTDPGDAMEAARDLAEAVLRLAIQPDTSPHSLGDNAYLTQRLQEEDRRSLAREEEERAKRTPRDGPQNKKPPTGQ
jgi:hypothetical protein